MPALFDTVPQKDYFGFFDNGKLNSKKVVEFFDYQKKEVSQATGIPEDSIRYDKRMPQKLHENLMAWASAVTLVANFLEDPQKTVLWFQIPNPLLGNISPKEMIRFGRYKKLLNFIQNSIDENRKQVNKPAYG